MKFLYVCMFSMLTTLTGYAQVSPEERQSLIDFYNSTDGDNWTNTINGDQPWLINDVNSSVNDWFGVTVIDKKVTKLELESNSLLGKLPPSFVNLAFLEHLDLDRNRIPGDFPIEILELAKLKHLSMWACGLSGSLPSELVQLSNLQVLSLPTNGFSGSIPIELSRLSQLLIINFQGNKLSGFIPPELGRLNALQKLNLGLNNLSGKIPSELGELSQLTDISLIGNSLTGSIPPELGQLGQLQVLGLSTNQLTGSIPPELGQLSSIDVFSIAENQLSGAIPAELGQLSKLRLLNLNNNNLSGSLPKQLGQLSNLVQLNLKFNQLSGTIPSEFVQLKELSTLRLSNNSFSGSVTKELGLMNKLRILELQSNKLGGAIPNEFSGANSLTFLSFTDNQYIFSDLEPEFTVLNDKLNYFYNPQAKVDEVETVAVEENGTITLTSTALTSTKNSYQWFKDNVAIPGATNKDYSIENASDTNAGVYHFTATNSIVTGLTLERNPITLTISEDSCGVSASEKQALIDLYNSTNGDNWKNTIAGNQQWLINDPNSRVCDWFGVTVVDKKVTKLEILNNNLVGSMPESIGDLIYLQRLRLVNENWGGSSLPTTIGNLTALTFLQIGGGSNGLGGAIPNEIGNLINLRSLNLSVNELSGPIPTTIGNLTNLVDFYANNNNLESLPSSIGNLTNLANLYLLGNNISGPIPPEIGKLSNLLRLLIASNNFSGPIPPEIGNLSNLIWLHLYKNQLEGELPPQLGDLQNLGVFYVYENNLSGAIPSSYGNWNIIRTVGIQENSFSGSLPVEWSRLTNLTRLSFDTNNFIFSDFENSHSLYETTATALYEYSPQAKVDEIETLEVPEGEEIVLTSNVLTSTNNSYQWFKDNVAISGATSKDYSIENASDADAGVYHFTATNSIVTGLTLERNPITLTVSEDSCGVSASEKQALIDLYNSTGGTNWTNNTNWLSDKPVCDWFGVTVIDGKVTILNFLENNLVGNLSNSINALKYLEKFSAPKNKISGIIPSEFGQLASLKILDLKDNGLSGNIPVELGQLALLEFMELNRNQLSGSIPSELGNLRNLTILNLSLNQLTGEIPIELANLTELQLLILTRNLLSGSIPTEFKKLSNINTLYLDYNKLSGTIPSELGELTSVRKLSLRGNLLSGVIPPELGFLENVNDLRLNFNQLTGNIPLELGQLGRNTTSLSLRLDNNKLTGKIPKELSSITIFSIFTIQGNEFVFSDFESEFSIYQSNLDANFKYFPQAKVDELEALSVEENGTTTLTSAALTSTSNSYQWFKDNAAISGATNKDFSIENASDADAGVYHFTATNSIVTGLILERNPITLTIKAPVCNDVSEAERQALIDFYNATGGANWTDNTNWLSDKPVSDWRGVTVEDCKVSALRLINNNLIGAIPTAVGALSNLSVLWLERNSLTGTLPIEFANLLNLENVHLNHNNLSGKIPFQFDGFTKLIYLHLNFNSFVFNDFNESILSISGHGYSGQSNLKASEDQEINEGGSLVIKANERFLEPNNTYKWYKSVDDGVTYSPIPWANERDLIIDSVSITDDAIYRLRVSNSNYPSLALIQEPTTIAVTPDLCGVSESERQALLDLYTATNGANWINTGANNKPWNADTSVCNWYGVTVVDGKVIEVNLEGNNVVGQLPASINNLLHLTTLNLGNNQLTGTIPSSIGGLENLTTLILEQNQFTGQLPVSIGSLSNLVTLELGNNLLQGDIPISFCNLSKLEVLDLSNNQITGILIPEFGFLKQLVRLDVSNNKMTGVLPSGLQSLSRLEFIGLSNNSFQGKLPIGLSNLSNLQALLFENNNFIFSDFERLHDGFKTKLTTYSYAPQADVDAIETKSVTTGNDITLSTRLSSENNTYVWYKDGQRIANNGNQLVITNATAANAGDYYFTSINSTIENLELTRNKITLSVVESCAIPIAQRQALIDLFNVTNGQSWTNEQNQNQKWNILDTQSKVCDWYGVTVENGNVTGINLKGNNLSGTLPATLGNLASLKILNLSTNQLLGTVPASIASIPTLTTFNIDTNQLIFINFEAQYNTYSTQLTNFTYSPQDKVDNEETKTVEAGKSITLTTDILVSTNNKYQWLKNGLPIEGATSKTYTIANVKEEDAGTYAFEATNTIIDNLTISRRAVILEVTGPVDGCGVSETEKQALIDLYNSTDGANWTNNTNWLTDEPVCDWFGVSVEDGTVIKLSLTSNNLIGELPIGLMNLLNLERLSLDRNGLSGSIPKELGNLVKLISFTITANRLTGSIPKELGNMTNLFDLFLAINNLSGNLPIELSRLKNLGNLSLTRNNITGEIPKEYGEMTKLISLNIHTNELTGNIPEELANLSNLKTLRLHGNSLSGKIPSGLVNLLEFDDFTFQSNNFVFSDFEEEHILYNDYDLYTYTPQAKVDQEETKSVVSGQSITLTSTALTSTNNSYQWFKNRTAIQGATTKEYIINNATSADAGVYYFKATNSIVTGLTLERNPITLKVLDSEACEVSKEERAALIALYESTDGANWINTQANNSPWLINDPDSKVCDWFGVTVNADFEVFAVRLPNNNLRGEIPNALGQLIHAEVLELQQNKLIGAYPTALDTLIALKTLNLRENTLVGVIPESIGNLKQLEVLDLGLNRFIGAIPKAIGNLADLVHIDLSFNKLREKIPEEFWNLTRLETIKLQDNQFTGGISDNIGNIPELEVFWVSNNKLSGSIPQTITLRNTPNLYSIHIDNNNFSGDLPQLIPNLSLPNTSVQINNNAFIFNDFETEFPEYQSQLSNFVYSPQAFVDQTETKYLDVGDAITLTSDQLVSPNNRYQWYKRNSQGVFEIIQGATSKDFLISAITQEQFGQYRFIATNTVVTGLQLTRRTITLIETVDTDGDGIPDSEDPDDDNDGCPDDVEIENGSDPLDPDDNNCPDDPDPDYVFCDSLSTTSIANLPIPNDGDTVLWFDNETDTLPIDEEEELFESQILWAEVDGDSQRIEVPISINEGAPGIFEGVDANGEIIDESFQVFNPRSNPTIANLQITPSQGISWYELPTSTMVLDETTILEDGGLYYAALNGSSCRFEVEVFLGIPDIFADGIQYFCAANAPTLASLEVVKTSPENGVKWYSSEAGETVLPENTALIDGTTYYATQFDGFDDESEVRVPVQVVVWDIELPQYLNSAQVIIVKEGQIATVADLLDRDPTITWYQNPDGGQAYRPSDPLINGDTYYAAQINAQATCESKTRLAVTVYLQEEQPPILISCEKFKPQPGDRYVMSGWVREQGVKIQSSETKNFIEDKAASDRLLELLNHLVNDFVLKEDPERVTRFLKEEYIPDIENKVYDAILPYVENGPTNNLTIYNFKYVTEDRITQGYKRTIGFQFSFSPSADADDYDFKYVSPPYEPGNNPQRYPIFNNPSINIEFTGFVVSGGGLQVLSKFNIDNTNLSSDSPFLNNNKSDHLTNFDNIALTNDFITYEADLDYQAMDYANSLIEVVYEDEEGAVLNLDPQYKVSFKPKGSIIDGWQRISTDFIVPTEAAFMSIVLKNTSGLDVNSYFDDIRFHPFDSNIKTFVYDPETQRLQAELDENNYATFYEYDQEGGLIRVKKETERGVYTIQETRSGNAKRSH